MKTETYERYITPKTKAGGMSAKRYNYEVIFLSEGSPYSAQLEAFGGTVGILRWKG